MLLTKKNSGTAGASSSPFVHSLRRGLTQALPTLDRRTFLRRSGLGVGVCLSASQFSFVKKAQAASTTGSVVGAGKVEVKRTICTHCSVGCLGEKSPSRYDKRECNGCRQSGSQAHHLHPLFSRLRCRRGG
ncbi:MAG: hypothetical protein NTX67_13705 [Burkholderiales bacterium]|nr:hypothetical protein [Burkholderiales bacterium]